MAALSKGNFICNNCKFKSNEVSFGSTHTPGDFFSKKYYEIFICNDCKKLQTKFKSIKGLRKSKKETIRCSNCKSINIDKISKTDTILCPKCARKMKFKSTGKFVS